MKLANVMTDTELADAYGMVAKIQKWCTDVTEEAMRRANEGATLPGFKLVVGRQGNRAWFDKQQAADVLSILLPADQLYKPREIVSPTDVEKIMKKDMPLEWDSVQTLIMRPDGKPSLVRDTDARPALGAVALEFPVLS